MQDHQPRGLPILAFVCLLFVTVELLSCFIPPFSSLDEFTHIKRAYQLSRGDVIPKTIDGVEGGYVDEGLIEFMSYFDRMPFHYDRKVDQQTLRASRRVQWSHTTRFSEFPNTVTYFPLIYLPQALALLTGRKCGLSVSDSYYLARLFSLVATLALMLSAFSIYPVSPVVAALFLIPMTLFQLSSASLDAVAFGLMTLSCSIFMRSVTEERFSDFRPQAALFLCLLALITSRPNLLPLALLPAVSFVRYRRRYLLFSSTVLFCAWVSWIACVKFTVPELGPPQELTSGQIEYYYITHPIALVRVLFATVGTRDALSGYWASFVGTLGWDDSISPGMEIPFGILILVLAAMSLQRKRAGLLSAEALSLDVIALSSVLLMLLMELATWTHHPADVIYGVQGRYFFPVLVLLSFSLLSKPLSQTQCALSALVLLALVSLSVCTMGPKLLQRYWIDDTAGQIRVQ